MSDKKTHTISDADKKYLDARKASDAKTADADRIKRAEDKLVILNAKAHPDYDKTIKPSEEQVKALYDQMTTDSDARAARRRSV